MLPLPPSPSFSAWVCLCVRVSVCLKELTYMIIEASKSKVFGVGQQA